MTPEERTKAIDAAIKRMGSTDRITAITGAHDLALAMMGIERRDPQTNPSTYAAQGKEI